MVLSLIDEDNRNRTGSPKRRFKIKPLAVASLLAIVILTLVLFRFQAPQKTKFLEPSPPAHPLQVLAFFENGWGGIYGDSFPGFRENYPFIDLLSPFWYSLDDSGRIRVNRSRSEVRDFAAKQGIPILPLVTNWQGRSGGFLINDRARRTSLANLLDLARNYNGLNLDIEYLPPGFKEPLVRYVQELRSLLAREQKQLLVCVYPQVDFPESRSGIHDYQGLSAACDGLILMAYDYHRPGTPAGPVAPLPWVEANIQNTLRTVPSSKLWLGIPGYGYQWRGAGTRPEALPAWRAEQVARERNLSAEWDATSRTPVLTYPENGDSVTVWFENRRSMEEKLKLAQKYRLQGVALWRLGYEVKDFWGWMRNISGVK